MSSQASLTLLLVAADRLARADFDAAGGSPKGWWTKPRERNTSLADGVRLALAQGGRPGQSVWVLCEDAWTQNIDLARGQVSGLSREQIARALAFEVEPFSGMPITESALGFHESEDRDGVKSFWIVEMGQSEREAVHEIVRSSGGKLSGICHPGGVPKPMDPTVSGKAWRRLEAWNGAMVWLECNERQDIRTRIVTSAPSLWQAPAQSSLELLGTDAGGAIVGLEPNLPAKRYFLNDENVLRLWLEAWAQALRSGVPSTPFVAAPAPKPTPYKYVVAGIALEIAAIVLVLLILGSGVFQRGRLKKEQAEIARLNQETQAVTKENAALRKEIADLELRTRHLTLLAGRRTALPALLKGLASSRPEDVVLNGIRPGNTSNLIVSGLALEAISVDEMSMVLTEMLRPAGWMAQPLQKTARRTLPNAGPWEFSISLFQPEEVQASSTATARRAR